MNATVLLLLALAAQAAIPTKGGGAAIEAKDVRVTLVPEKATIFLGEPITADLVVKNVSAGPLYIEDTNEFDLDNLMASQRTIQLTAVDEKDTAAPAPAWRRPPQEISFMLTSLERDLPPGGSTSLRFDLPPLVTFEHPGAYTLKATATLMLSGQREGYGPRIPVEASATLEVLPPDPEQMGRLIEELEKKSTLERFAVVDEDTHQEEAARFAAGRKLNGITDERVIAFYRRQMRHAGREDELTATLEALSKFNNDAALDGLKDGLEITEFVSQYSHKPAQDELERVHIAAAKGLFYSPHPGAIPLLLAHSDDPDPQVRCIVIEALASGKVPPAEAIPILQHLAKDKTDFVADRAKYALTKPPAKKAP